MRYAVSNIALTAFDHAGELAALPAFGLEGVEVAPSRVWPDTWESLTGAAVRAYRKQVENSGLSVVGLHSLFFDHPDLGLITDADTRTRTLDFVVHLSGLCRDLGGRTLVWGGGRKRGPVAQRDARAIALDFLDALCPLIEGHGTCLCFEPLGPADSDFVNSALEAFDIVEAVDSPAFAVQLDAKALVENEEATEATFTAVANRLVHFHANEPGLGVLGSSGAVDHRALGSYLAGVGYNGWVTIEQRLINESEPLVDVERSATVVKEAYP